MNLTAQRQFCVPVVFNDTRETGSLTPSCLSVAQGHQLFRVHVHKLMLVVGDVTTDVTTPLHLTAKASALHEAKECIQEPWLPTPPPS